MVGAAHKLGKDWISGFLALWFYASRSPCRVLTSSVDHSQLQGVLWGEIRAWYDSAQFDLGLKLMDLRIKQVRPDGSFHPKSEMIGRVARPGSPEGLLGRHMPYGPNGEPMTFSIIDEASGFSDIHLKALRTWSHQILVIGNTYASGNFFEKGLEEGDKEDAAADGDPSYPLARKCIRIRADQSPNVRLGMQEVAAGQKPSHKILLPGVMTYGEYLNRLEWTDEDKAVGLFAEFWRGEETKLFPEDWIESAILRAAALKLKRTRRQAKAMGIDPAAGGDNTTWTIVDELGIIKQISKKTPDTSKIVDDTIALGEEYGIEPEQWLFDAAKGKEHADRLARLGYPAQIIYFGGSPTADEKDTSGAKVHSAKGAYKNRRSQMYGEIREVISPRRIELRTERINGQDVEIPETKPKEVFAIPGQLAELIRQMRPIPYEVDEYGRFCLIPKDKKGPNDKGKNMKALLGCSPDELDSLALAVHGMLHRKVRRSAMVV